MEKSQEKRGQESEQNVALVLRGLREDGVIVGFRRTRHYSHDDRQKIDFFLFFEHVRRMPLQVKSSHLGVRVHRHYYGEVPCVLGRGPSFKIRTHILQLIEQHLKGVVDGHTTG
jgi:hypothetical protein